MGSRLLKRPLHISHKWIVFVAAVSVAFFYYGIAASLGGLYIAMLDTFNAGRAKTAFVQSLLITFAWGFGLISGLLISRFGMKIVTYCAAVFTSAGFIVSYFAVSIYQLYGFISVIVGMGIATMYLEAVLSVSRSFSDRQRSIAISVQSIGTAISGIMWPRLFSVSLDLYSLRGTFLILGGVLLNNIAFAIIFAEVERNYQTDVLVEEQCYTKATCEEITEMSGITPEAELANNKDCIVDCCELETENNDETFHYPYEDGKTNKGNIISCEQDDIDTCKTDIKGIDNMINNDNIEKLNYNKRTNKNDNVKGESKHDAVYKMENKYSNIIKVRASVDKMVSGLRNENRCLNPLLCIYSAYTLASILHMSALTGLLILYQDINVFNGLSVAQSDVTYMVYSLFNISSRFLPVIPAQIRNLNIFTIPILSSLCASIGQIFLLCVSPSMAISITTMAFCGIADGGWASSMQVIMFEILPIKKQVIGFGFVLTAMGVASAATGPLFGLSRDDSTSYQTVLIITTSMFGASVLLVCLCLVKSTRLANKP